MPNILKAPAKVHAAKNFLNSFYDAGGTDHIYLALGDAGGEWGTPASPDIPIDSYNEELAFWANMRGMGEISQSTSTELVTLRKNWVSGTTYVAYNPAVDSDSGSFDTGTGRDWYVANTNVNPKVYRCVLAGGGTSTDMPDHNNPLGVVETDGFKWEYLYTVGVDVSSALATPTWLPVPSGGVTGSYSNGMATTIGQLCFGDGSGNYDANTIYQITASTGATSSGADMDTDSTTGNNTWEEWYGDQRVGAFYVSCQLSFPDSAGTGGLIPNVAYRQVALLRNPKDSGGARITSQWAGSGWETTVSTGVVLTLDNRVTITRAVGQTETVRLVLEF